VCRAVVDPAGVHIGSGVGGDSGGRIAYAAAGVLSLARGTDDDRRRASQGIGVRFAVTLAAFPGALMPLEAADC
jgi:hypothetical protein